MRKFLVRIIIFFCFFPFFYLSMLIIYGKLLPQYFHKNLLSTRQTAGFSNTRFKEVDSIENIDILFLGSSRSYRHYDVRNFNDIGSKSFNLGSGGQTFVQTEVLVNRYFDELNPKLVIFDIHPGMFSENGLGSTLDILVNDANDEFSRKLVWDELNGIIFNTWIYSQLRNKILNETYEDPKKDFAKYISGGFVERKVTQSEKVLNLLYKWQIKESQWQAFENIIRKLRASDAKLILITSPYQSTITEEKKYQLQYFLDRKKIKYLDYSHIPQLNDTMHFYDPIHLNQDGVNIFNDLLIKDLFK